MRLRSTLLLAAILAGLGVYLYFVEAKREVGSEDKKQTLVALNADDATALTLQYGDREIALVKQDATWRLTKPLEAAADDMAVKNLLRAIAEADVKKTIDDPPADLLPFGLAPPFVIVTVSTAAGELPALEVGKNTAVSYSTYVRRADGPTVYLTGSAFRTGVDKQVTDLRDKSIVSYVESDIDTVALVGPGGRVELVKEDGNWWIAEPSRYRADNAAVRSLLSTVRNLRATEFANDNPSPDDLAAYGLEPPQRSLTFRGANGGSPVQLDVGKETEQGLYIKAGDRPTTFIVGKWLGSELDKGVNELRDKTLLSFDPATASRIEVARADGNGFTLESTDGRWVLASSDQPLNAASADAFVGAVSQLAGTRVLAESATDLAAFGLAEPVLSIAVTGQDGNVIGTVRIGSHNPDPPATQYTAQRTGDAAIMQLGDYQFRQLDKQASDLGTPPRGVNAADLEPFAGDEP